MIDRYVQTIRRCGSGVLVAAATVLSTAVLSTAALAQQPLTGGDVSGPVKLRLVSCCKTTYFGPAVERWNAKNPGIQIEQEVIPFAQLNEVLEARLRTRDAGFDIFVLDPPRTAAFAAKRYLLDISSTLGPELKKTTNPESLEATSFMGKLHALPVFNSTQILIYNPDILAKAGIPEPSIDPKKRATWEDIAKAAQTAKEKAGLQYGIAFSQGHTYYQLQPMIMSGGGKIGLSGDNNLTPDVSSPEWKKVMEWYGGLYAQGLAPRGVPFPQMDALFTSGKAAFLATTSDRVREFQKQNVKFGVAAFPAFAGGKAYTPCDSFALAINPYSKHQKQAAQFLQWLGTTKDGGHAAAAESPNVPANMLVRDEVSNEMEQASPNLKGLTDLITYETTTTCVHRPASVGYIQFETAFVQANMDIINGTNAAEALDKMQKQLVADFSRLR